jgi:hypothetical protein
MAAKSQPIGLRGCRETMSAAGKEKDQQDPGVEQRRAELRRAELGFVPGQLRDSCVLRVQQPDQRDQHQRDPRDPPSEPDRSPTTHRSPSPDHCLVVPSDPEVRPKVLAKDVTTHD